MALKDFRFENLPRSTQILIFVALAAGLAALFYTYYLQGPIVERDELRNEVARLEAAVAEASYIESQLAQFRKDLAELERRLNELRRILPDQKETPEVLRGVQRMAASSNLKIMKFHPQPVVARDFYSDWPIVINLQGSYNALGSFFERISYYPRIINVDNITIKGIEGSTDASRTLNATCTATTFVFREGQVVNP